VTEGPAKAYGDGRTRAGVSYAEVERTAIAILKSERRPTVKTVRDALGTGSPDTIATALKRFWHDLGARIEGDLAALTRMPPDIVEFADGMWQRALKLAGEAAKHEDNAARERLKQITAVNEIRAHSLSLREKEWDTAARERERALATPGNTSCFFPRASGAVKRRSRHAMRGARISRRRSPTTSCKLRRSSPAPSLKGPRLRAEPQRSVRGWETKSANGG